MQTAETINDLAIDTLQLKKASLIFRAVNHKLRQEILSLLHQNQRMAVTAVYVKLRMEQSVTSQHLAILRKAGFVTTQREGKQIFYSVNYDRLNQVTEIAKALNYIHNL